jgi:hypothetical protein
VRNADILCNPIIDRNSDITPQALSLRFSQVKNQLKFKSAAHSKADDLALKPGPTEAEAYRNWLRVNHLGSDLTDQRRDLKTGGV